jgi:hypothetical protein
VVGNSKEGRAGAVRRINMREARNKGIADLAGLALQRFIFVRAPRFLCTSEGDASYVGLRWAQSEDNGVRSDDGGDCLPSIRASLTLGTMVSNVVYISSLNSPPESLGLVLSRLKSHLLDF